MGTVISLTFSLVQWILFLLAIIGAYELIRWAIVSFVKRRLMQSVTRFLRAHEVRFDQYKLTNKLIIRDQLLHNKEVSEQILEEARNKGIPYEEARETAEQYIDEIVPTFNLLSYYKFGSGIARMILRFLYEVNIDEGGRQNIRELPEDSLVIYVMNHRSNLDYIVVAFMLMENISVSYAVGEWARVFPLDILFKSFGAYFVRREFREPLYHVILKHYVQLISKNSVTQGIFLEGGLSRDGGFMPPKTGLLDYILTGTINQDTNIYFVPVGINYDWIIEDKTLIAEWKEGKKTPTLLDYLKSVTNITIRLPYLLLVNTLRVLTRRTREHGYASVKFGDPVPLHALVETSEIAGADRYTERRSELKAIGHQLLDRIGKVVPITPVSLLSFTLFESDEQKISKQECLVRMNDVRRRMEAEGAQLVMGIDYKRQKESRRHLEDERWVRKRELLEFEQEILHGDETERTLELGVEILTKRKIIKFRDGTIEIVPEKQVFLEYYANTIRHYLSPDSPR